MYWTDEKLETLTKLYQKYNYRICASMMDIKPSRVKAILSNRKITCGRNTQYKKGHVSHNKGIHKLCSAKCLKTTFKPGYIPANTKPLGFIVIKKDYKTKKPYFYIKVANQKWIPYHRYLWSRKIGLIPSGMMVVFKDGNSMNVNLDNLELITKAENIYRNRNHDKVSKTNKEIWRREKLRHKYGLPPLSGRVKQLLNYY